MYPLKLNVSMLGVSRELIFNALVAEGVPGLASGYVNVHKLPMYQKKIAYGSSGFPWSSDICRRNIEYSHGICPVAEDFHDSSYLGFAVCMHELSNQDIDLIGQAFRKVWSKMNELRV
jgi:dTDP-4-amino-4,6-dideoxygalactose transaminase